MDNEFYGERLAIIRYIKGLSLQDIADNLGLSKNAIHKIEKDQMRPSIVTLAGICQIFQLPNDFFTRKELHFTIKGNKLVFVNK